MIKRISLGLLAMALTTSCVSKKVYADLENQFADLKQQNRTLSDELEGANASKNQLDLDKKALQDQLDKLKAERDKLANDYAASANNLKTLQSSYKALEKNSDDALTSNMNKNRELLADLEAKEKALAAEKARLDKLSKDFKDRSDRVNELESLIAQHEATMKALKDKLSKALNAFEGRGLTVEHKNGKVYVSMENKLLFGTGSWTVGTEGRKAIVELGKVLGDNPDIAVLIEGHTDNDKFQGVMQGGVGSNWDLSTKRATAIINILEENNNIVKKNLTAAGRGEFAPIGDNDTAEGKAKNRRIEVILTPKLDEINKVLNEI